MNDLDIISLDLFPIRVYKFNIIDLYYNEICKLKEFAISKSNNDLGRQISNYGGWQSNETVINNIEIRNFCRILEDIINNVIVSKIHILNDSIPVNKIYVENIWINKNSRNDFNIIHTHSGSWYAGCIYLQVNDSTGSINFFNNFGSGCSIPLNNTIDNDKNSYEINPKDGDVLLFPSELAHYTLPNKSDIDRISIAFNLGIRR